MKKPVILPLFALVSGIITATAVHIPNAALYLCIFVSLLALSRSFTKKHSFSALISLLLAFCFLGALLINLDLYPKSSKKDVRCFADRPGPTIIEGVVCRPPRISEEKTRLVMESVRILGEGTSTPVSGKVLLTLKDQEHRYGYGDYIRIETKLKRTHGFKNPGGFDYERYLLFQGIRVRGYVKNASSIVMIRENSGNRLRGMIEKYRMLIRDRIGSAVPEPENRILHALILGEQDGIPREVRDNFTRAGVSHLLAISGLHVGIVAFLSFFVIKTVMKRSEYLLLRFNIIKTSALVSIIPIIGYAAVAGFRISTIRATIMILAFTVALIIGRERNLLNILAFAAFAILVFDPSALFDISFQLSFAAVASILMIMPVAEQLIPEKKEDDRHRYLRFARGIVLFIMVSFAATVGTAPLTVLYFNRLSTVTLLSNLFLIPLIGFIVLPLGIIAIIMVVTAPSLAAFFFWIAGFFISIARWIIDGIASAPLSSITMTTPSRFEIMLYYLSLIVLISLITAHCKKKRRLPYGIMLTILLSIVVIDTIWCHYQERCGGKLEATFIDVGQGSSALIKFPDGKKMLVDGGGLYDTFDIGESVVTPFLLDEKIRTLDVVVLTHPDRDHLGGLPSILNHFKTGEVWTNGEESESDVYHDFIVRLDHAAIPHRKISAVDRPFSFGETTITILNPPEVVSAAQGETGNDTNENSIVMKIAYGTVAILLPADIPGTVEYRLAAEGECPLKSTVLLVPHHGSRTSSTQSFVEAVRPDIAVISCGFNNIFGFPHQEVLDRYETIGAEVFRTDRHGAVTFITDGSTLSIGSVRNRRWGENY